VTPPVRESDEWDEVAWDAPESDVYPDEWAARERWMAHTQGEKMPFAPWGERDHPAAEPDTDARWKWGLTDNYTTLTDAREWVDHLSGLGGVAFLLAEAPDEPHAFVDGDDVRCPKTGEWHPEFVALLNRLGMTYADVSTSGTGVHAVFAGALPEGVTQAVIGLDDEPWGANESIPEVEIYDHKHVCVCTGEHVTGTPTEVRPWDDDALRAFLDDHDELPTEPDPVAHDTDRDRSVLDEHDPQATGADETTNDVRDVLAAVDRLVPRDVPLQTRPVGTDATGWQLWNPSTYRASASGKSLHKPPDEPVFHDHKHGEAFGVLSLYAAEQGIISRPWDRLAGDDWWDAVDAAREGGAPIPEFDGHAGGQREPVAVLPPAVRDLSTDTGRWGSLQPDHPGDDTLTLDDARERTTEAIADAYNAGDRALVDVPPGAGKSRGLIEAAAETDTPITVFTGRGRKEQYEQFREWADEHGLTHYTLPAFHRDCLTANGEHGDDWQRLVREWVRDGVSPQAIHARAEEVLGHPLPCQQHDDAECPYTAKWRFDPDEYDVLVGHPTHAHVPKVVRGRAVAVDEFPGDAYETQLDDELPGIVSRWLAEHDAVPYEDYTDLLENRDDDERRAEAFAWFDEHGIEPDELHALGTDDGHAAAPLAVATLLGADDLGNGWERARLGDGRVGVRDRENDTLRLLRPPDLQWASSVIALDGTPTPALWELALGEQLNHRQVLTDAERAEYITDALNLNLVPTTEHVKPYNSEQNVAVDRDAALLDRIREVHDEHPGLITTSTALDVYDDAGILDAVAGTKHYGNVKGSNTFGEKRVGAVIGSNHYGDGFVKKWSAYEGRAAERGDGKGADLSYGPFGDDVLQHMREHDTLQAAMRFGRDGDGATVYVHTDTLPDWVPTAGEGRVLDTYSDGLRSVVTALEHLGDATTAEITAHPAVEIGRRQVLDHLRTLAERGHVDDRRDESDGRRLVWRGDGLHRVNEHGEVQLPTVALDEIGGEEVDELARSSIYTWEFVNRDAAGGSNAVDTPPGGTDEPSVGESRGSGPPDRA